MKNLQNFGVQELNSTELKETNGGAWPWWVVVSVVGMVYDAGKGFVKGFKDQLKEEASKLNV